MFRLMIAFVFVNILSVSLGDVPLDFQVLIQRDRTQQLRIGGVFYSSEENNARLVAPWLQSYDCGNVTRTNDFFITIRDLNDTRATFDVTDMVQTYGETSTLTGFCIGYESALSRSIESTIYMKDAGRELLVFRPTNPREFAESGAIIYTRIIGNGQAFVRTTTSPTGANISSLTTVVFGINGNVVSSIAEETFYALNQTIRAAGGRLRNRLSPRLTAPQTTDVFFDNCYENLINVLPTITYVLSNEPLMNSPATSRIVFYPEDYFVQTRDPNICTLLVDAARPGYPLALTDRFLTLIGGIHFDYANRRIGFFDPI